MTTQKITDGEFYHVSRELPYNHHPVMTVGAVLEIGSKQNPFFGYYESVLSYQVTLPEQVVQVPAIKFLKSVYRGEINCPTLPKIAAEVAEHYLILTREIIMEQVRREISAAAPSPNLFMAR